MKAHQCISSGVIRIMSARQILDDRAAATVGRLHALSDSQFRATAIPYVLGTLMNRLRGNRSDFTQSAKGKAVLRDKLVALDVEKAELCYLLCRSLNARRVVEAGTSFGVSTIYLAAAVRDHIAAQGGTGTVIGTEHEPTKAEAARKNFADAGVADFVDLREGDLRETLKDVGGPVDFMLVDIWIPMARPALELVTPRLRPGAIVMCDNVVQFAREYADYLGFVRDPAKGFRSMTLPFKGGVEMSVWVG